MDKIFAIPPTIFVGTIALLYVFQMVSSGEFSQNMINNKIESIASKDNLAVLHVSESIDSHAVMHLSTVLYNAGNASIHDIKFSMGNMGLLGRPYDKSVITTNLNPGKTVSYDEIVMPVKGDPNIGTKMPVTIEGILQNGKNIILHASTVVGKTN
ncbi:hypothetical protein [Candidatus Nitrosotalea okcheonensis]|uniref:Uncharacterized protein n=1 Tax=Candidatus Nitrosotalea okcheonensis TaxID=1903276 RepID=A0A2H1FEM0_9ARCH|nr:hypothetical protein [Candidatus Nitrosotalea okcheonensis]MDE1727868.1 hypothetical protein [Nitrososphaerota archaeon]MDE1831828.1 hypothetical protein [Nitrososphaerota archaeon]MDE1840425.1 hypothetical protein [Nitrososphaerota archaeon]MDE1877390.1 hypothetical protein [Nitrososphaerota archaeon]SMH71207.1 protein of unknown function [Candidatus Nitrosotalea okcheonensis]